MNHEGLLWNVYCVAIVVLRIHLNFTSAVIRSKRSSCCNILYQITPVGDCSLQLNGKGWYGVFKNQAAFAIRLRPIVDWKKENGGNG